jgi:hypothetical protein
MLKNQKTKKPNRSVESIAKSKKAKSEKYQTIQILKDDYDIMTTIKTSSYPATVSQILKHYIDRPCLTVVIDSWGNLKTVNIYTPDNFWRLYDETKGINIWNIYKDSELLISCDQAKSTLAFVEIDLILKKYLDKNNNSVS